MKIVHKYGVYVCPHGKLDGKTGVTQHKKYSVSGRYCKNNCEKYKKSCSLFSE